MKHTNKDNFNRIIGTEFNAIHCIKDLEDKIRILLKQHKNNFEDFQNEYDMLDEDQQKYYSEECSESHIDFLKNIYEYEESLQ